MNTPDKLKVNKVTATELIAFKNLDTDYKTRITQEIIDLRNRNHTYNDCIDFIDKEFQVTVTRYDVYKVLQDKAEKTPIAIRPEKSRAKTVIKSLVISFLVITTILLGMVFIGVLIIQFIIHPLIYPLFYWMTYFSTIIGVLTVIFTISWYSKVRKKFSSPMKQSKISAVRLIVLIVTIVGVSQLVLIVFYEELLFQVSIVLLITSLIFQGVRTITNISLSLTYRNKNERTNNGPLVTIILPAYNEAKVIEKTINSLIQLSYRPKEIIVVNDGSKDDTLNIARTIAKKESIKVISKTNGGKWSALNKGIEEANGEIMVCIDADTILERNAIEYLIPYFDDKRIAAVAGNIKVGNRNKNLTKLQALEYVLDLNILRRSESSIGKITVVPGPLGAFRKSVIKQVGFYSGDTFAEDSDLTMKILKAGYKIKYEKRALGYTEAPSTLIDLAKQRYRWYRGQIQTMKKHVDAIFSVPWVFFNGIILSWFTFFTLLWLFVLMINPYSAFVIYAPQPISMPSGGVAELINVIFFQATPILYIFWYVVFLFLDICTAIYAIGVDVREKPKLLIYIIVYKLFYVNLIDTIRIISQLEEYLNYPMRWEIAQRSGNIKYK